MADQEGLHLQGADNFRSLRGMPARCGRRIGDHSLLRADQLHRLTARDWQVLQRLGLKAVCDLRSTGERERYPSCLPEAGMHHLHLEITGDLRADRRIAGILADNPVEGGARDMMLALYRGLPAMLAPHMPTLFRLFTSGRVPVLIHCAAGKDRTGVAVALILHALGVEPERIMADYVLSTRRFAQLDTERQQTMNSAVSRMVGQSVSEAALDAVLDAHPEYLNAAYAEIEVQYGGLDHYIQRFSGLDRSALQALRNSVLGA